MRSDEEPPGSEEPVLRLGLEHTVKVSLKATPKPKKSNVQRAKEFPENRFVAWTRNQSLSASKDSEMKPKPRVHARRQPVKIQSQVSFEKELAEKAPSSDSNAQENEVLRLGMEHTVKVSLKVAPKKSNVQRSKELSENRFVALTRSRNESLPELEDSEMKSKPKSKPEAQGQAGLQSAKIQSQVSFEKEWAEKSPSSDVNAQENEILRLGMKHTVRVPLKVTPRSKAEEEHYLSEEDKKEIKEALNIENEWVEKSDAEDTRHAHMGWFVILGTVLLSILAWGGMSLWSQNSEQLGSIDTGEIVESTSESFTEKISGGTKKERDEAAETYHQMELRIARYFAATKVEDLRGMVRHEKRVMPMIESYYQRHSFAPREYHSIDSTVPMAIDNRPFLVLQVAFQDGSTAPLLLEDTQEGVLIDWETERTYQPVDPAIFIQEKMTDPVNLRVWASLDNYYSHQFQDESRYLSFRLSFPSIDEYLFGYIERDSGLARRFDRIYQNKENEAFPLLLKIAFSENGRAPRSVMILDLVSSQWAYGDQPKNWEDTQASTGEDESGGLKSREE